jgi:hypothetical protein
LNTLQLPLPPDEVEELPATLLSTNQNITVPIGWNV